MKYKIIGSIIVIGILLFLFVVSRLGQQAAPDQQSQSDSTTQQQ